MFIFSSKSTQINLPLFFLNHNFYDLRFFKIMLLLLLPLLQVCHIKKPEGYASTLASKEENIHTGGISASAGVNGVGSEHNEKKNAESCPESDVEKPIGHSSFGVASNNWNDRRRILCRLFLLRIQGSAFNQINTFNFNGE